jgi:NAD(P)H-dependent flavin oxidoreductase YrpB (nitropropane dioxygenase family)
MLQTKMTEILGIKYPIQCGTMQGITTSELVAPVANAGGSCCIPAATCASAICNLSGSGGTDQSNDNHHAKKGRNGYGYS